MANVFIVHHGKQKYLRYCLEISEKNGNNTYLIGNESGIATRPENFISDDMEMPLFREFTSKYKHMSPSPIDFEMLCFKRYFQLLNVVEDFKDEYFWIIDSDVLLLDNLQHYESELKVRKYDNALWTPKQQEYAWISSAGLSLWTVESLNSFVNYILWTYSYNLKKLEEKWFNHLTNKIPGGICDMTLLYLWSEERKSTYNIYNSYIDFGIIDDNNICFSDNVKIKTSNTSDCIQTIPIAKIKKVFYINNKYYIKTKNDPKFMQIRSLHFQGNSKVYMQYFGKHKTTDFFSVLKPIAINLVNNLRSKLKLRSLWNKYFK